MNYKSSLRVITLPLIDLLKLEFIGALVLKMVPEWDKKR